MNKKVIAVIGEMEKLPERCANCPLEIDCFYCAITGLETDELRVRPDWCPLKKLPERLEQYEIGGRLLFDPYFIDGFQSMPGGNRR